MAHQALGHGPLSVSLASKVPSGPYPANVQLRVEIPPAEARERCQPNSLEEHVPPLPQPLPVSKLLAEGDAPVFGEAEDIELLVVDELRRAPLCVIHLQSVELLLEGWCLGRDAGVCLRSTTHGHLRDTLAGLRGVGIRHLAHFSAAGRELLAQRRSSREVPREPNRSEVQVSPLLKEPPVGELLAESKPAVLRKAEDVELLVIHELGGTLFCKVLLDVTQILGAEVNRSPRVVGRFVVIVVHGTSHSCWFAFCEEFSHWCYALRRDKKYAMRAGQCRQVARFERTAITGSDPVVRWVPEGSPTGERSGVTKRRTNQEQSEALETAGWKLKETGGGKRLWERPGSGRLYPQTAAYWLVKRQERKREETA